MILDFAIEGDGGSNPWGRGGKGGAIYIGQNDFQPGLDGQGYGAGGGGAASGKTGIDGDPRWAPGGNGAPGLIIVDSYSAN